MKLFSGILFTPTRALAFSSSPSHRHSRARWSRCGVTTVARASRSTPARSTTTPARRPRPSVPRVRASFSSARTPRTGATRLGTTAVSAGRFPGVLLGTAFIPIVGERGAFGDIDLTQFDTRNFDSPASASAVEALREGTARDAGAAGAGKPCAVCLSEYEGEERVKTIPKCGHTFHADCLMEWLKTVRDRSARNARVR